MIHLRPETEIEAGDTWTLAVNINQTLLGKTVVILNRPCDAVTALTGDEWGDLHVQLRRLRVALGNLFAPDQYNYAFLMNLDRQVHLHVVPRYIELRAIGSGSSSRTPTGAMSSGRSSDLCPDALIQLRDAIRGQLPENA